MPRKKLSPAKLADKCAVDLQKLVRMKAADDEGYCKCVTCDVVKHWTELQGGHFISRVVTKLKLVEENIHPQCQSCNGFKHGNQAVYTMYMIDTYGKDLTDEFVQISKSRPVHKWNVTDITDLHNDIKAQLKDQAQRLDIQ